jgi:hypothetical protein
MIFLPWIVFFLGTAYMIWRGFSERRKYLQEQVAEHDRAKAAEEQEKIRRMARENELVETLLTRLGR